MYNIFKFQSNKPLSFISGSQQKKKKKFKVVLDFNKKLNGDDVIKKLKNTQAPRVKNI